MAEYESLRDQYTSLGHALRLAQHLEQNIASGKLAPGARAMSAHEYLHQYAEANALSVEDAYEELTEQAW
jgi:DNA-binding transcriptional MocR family regulator